MPWQIEDYNGEMSLQAILDQMSVESGVIVVAVHDESRAAHLLRRRREVLAGNAESRA